MFSKDTQNKTNASSATRSSSYGQQASPGASGQAQKKITRFTFDEIPRKDWKYGARLQEWRREYDFKKRMEAEGEE